MTRFELPVVDLQGLPSSVNSEGHYPNTNMEIVVSELDMTLRQHGGCYLKNHDISASSRANIFAKSKDFFKLPAEVKEVYTKSDDKLNAYGGYYVSQSQRFRERFDVLNSSTGNKFPERHVPGFKEAFETYRTDCDALTHCLLTLIARAFKIDDHFFVDCHTAALYGTQDCGTKSHLSSLFYTNIDLSESEGQDNLLMAKHTDFTTLTLLASSARGLQVQPAAGGDRWINADPREGCILLNVGDLLERWTGGHYPATIHRVLKMRHEDSEGRQSIPYFVHPDYSALVEPIVEPMKGKSYPPVLALDYWNQKMSKQPAVMIPIQAKIWDAKTPECA